MCPEKYSLTSAEPQANSLGPGILWFIYVKLTQRVFPIFKDLVEFGSFLTKLSRFFL